MQFAHKSTENWVCEDDFCVRKSQRQRRFCNTNDPAPNQPVKNWIDTMFAVPMQVTRNLPRQRLARPILNCRQFWGMATVKPKPVDLPALFARVQCSYPKRFQKDGWYLTTVRSAPSSNSIERYRSPANREDGCPDC